MAASVPMTRPMSPASSRQRRRPQPACAGVGLLLEPDFPSTGISGLHGFRPVTAFRRSRDGLRRCERYGGASGSASVGGGFSDSTGVDGRFGFSRRWRIAGCCRRGRRLIGLVRRFMLRGRRLDVQHRQNGSRRRLRRLVWRENRFRAPRATTECWQIPRAPRAAMPRRRARTPVSTSTTRSRRTENGSPGAWTPVPPSLGSLRRPLSQKGTR